MVEHKVLMSEASGSKVREEYERRTRRNQAEVFAVQRCSLSGSTLVNPPGDAPRINTPDGALGPRVHKKPGFDVPKSDMAGAGDIPSLENPSSGGSASSTSSENPTGGCRRYPIPGKPIERRLGIEHELGKGHRRMQARSHQAEPGKPTERRPGIEHELGKPDRHGQKMIYEPENPSRRKLGIWNPVRHMRRISTQIRNDWRRAGENG
ncbi:hypothetical protein DFH06DRAFT_1442554 [Mycena polygramma]|nr:hypothetical protein DFH06DRAFT_1442554 [Mycena polygramma]